jgi:GT2 family glycosyltransferase
MKVSVVIPTYKRPGLAERLEKQIQNYTPDCEVIIIDQSSSNTPNTSEAKNQGIQKSTGDIIIFFDDDIEITDNTISTHLEEYANLDIFGVAGRVINDGETVPPITDVITGQMNQFGTDFTKNFWGERKQFIVHPYGCNMSFRKSVLDKIGGFDTKFPTPLSAFEEVDLGLRVSKLGKIIFSPGALVYHHRAVSGGTRVDQRTRNNQYYQSYGRLLRKHIKFPMVVLSIAILKLRILKESPYSLFSFVKGLFVQ